MGKKKTPVDDGHRSGNRCGYTQLPNGNTKVAPPYLTEMQTIIDHELCVQAISDAYSRSLQIMLKPMAERRRKLWKDLAEDYGIENVQGCSMNTDTGELMKPQQASDGVGEIKGEG